MLARTALYALLTVSLVRPVAAQREPPRKIAPTRPVPTPSAEIASPSTAAVRGLRDRAELEAFMDGIMTAQLRDHHVAGATVSVVKDGALFFAKGYGSADVRQQRPVVADSTMFRVGSISKLFTWTAVMQLVEQGKLDLNTDINKYLDFKIPATFPQPITLTHVMTHTPGFEEEPRDLFTEDSTHIQPMGKWLPAHMPKRVRPPGTFASYSNWATATAGRGCEGSRRPGTAKRSHTTGQSLHSSDPRPGSRGAPWSSTLVSPSRCRRRRARVAAT